MNLAWKEIKYNKKNYLLVEITLILLIFMVSFLSGLTFGLEKAASSAISHIEKSFFVLTEDAEGAIGTSSLSQEMVDELKKSDTDGEGIAISRGFIKTKDSDSKIDIAYFAVDKDSKLIPNVEGKEKLLEENTVLLNSKFKDEGIKLNDEIIDSMSDKPLKVVGFIEDNSYNYTDVGYISLKTNENMKKEVNSRYVTTYSAFLTDKENIKLGDDEEVMTRDEIINKLPGYSAQQKTIIMITWVLVIISASILGVFFYIITIQKQQQFGVMKALGMTNFEVSKILIKQIFILSLLGVIIANAIAIGLSTIMPPGLPFLLKYDELAIISVAFVVVSMLSGLISMLKIAKVDPLTIIGGAR